MPRKRTVDDLKARATTLQARAARERHAALEAQRRLKAAEALARREAHLRLGEMVTAVLGPISPEGLRTLLTTMVPPSRERVLLDAIAVPPLGNRGPVSSSRPTERPEAVGPRPHVRGGDLAPSHVAPGQGWSDPNRSPTLEDHP